MKIRISRTQRDAGRLTRIRGRAPNRRGSRQIIFLIPFANHTENKYVVQNNL